MKTLIKRAQTGLPLKRTRSALKILMAAWLLILSGCSVYDPIYDLGAVAIQYLDSATGEEIQPSVTHGDLPAGAYSYAHPDIAGYTFNAEKSDPGEGKLRVSENLTIRFRYDRLKQSVTIRYLDSATDEEIQPSVTHGDVPAGPYSYPHPDIEGWAFNAEKSDPGEGTLAAGGSVIITFRYDRLKQSVTIRYLDAATDEEIQPSVTHSDVPAGPYSYTAPDIAGWAFNAEKSDPGKGTIGVGESIVIRFYYDRQKQSITIRYLYSATDREIRPSVTHADVAVGPYSYTAPHIDGYTFNAGKSDSGTGTIGAGENIVIRFYYDEWQPQPSSITIRYLNADTDEEIQSSVIHNNVPAGAYSYTAPNIEDYRFNAERSDSGSGTIGEGENITVTFYYNRLVTFTIVYMLASDAGGYDILTSRVTKHVIGETIVGSKVAYVIKGYSFEYSNPAEITIKEDGQKIIIYYSKDNT